MRVKLTLSAQILLLIYHQCTTLIDLHPFNGVRFTKPAERYVEAAVNFVLMGFPIFAFSVRHEMLMRFGVSYYFILLGIECATWWLPCWLGASPDWAAVYARIHAGTIRLGSNLSTSPVPNLEHVILMVITTAVALITLREFRVAGVAFGSLWLPVIIGAGLITVTVFRHTQFFSAKNINSES